MSSASQISVNSSQTEYNIKVKMAVFYTIWIVLLNM